MKNELSLSHEHISFMCHKCVCNTRIDIHWAQQKNNLLLTESSGSYSTGVNSEK